ncbi:DUF1178 family protein [Roseateles koreensis]|uniref:DUF1178 family protein n=1 Tax=Roseateles koreensis TaxID=2987526 RepID=A0ABT5KQK6_9BURK|nr:DUF1178 family protein [Roseateles koreensis]MDC8785142.1 DUF1178 family protein [Roseateles koreensis]
MLVLNLACSQAHRFEGWFGSAADFESQTERGLLTCPMCGVDQIRRMPSAPHLNVSHLRSAKFASAGSAVPGQSSMAPDGTAVATRSTSPPTTQASSTPDSAEVLQALQSVVEKWVAEAIATTEDVGQQFAEEARRIHYGEAQARGIRGQATLDETLALSDEGIEVIALPLAPGAKNKLQ